MSIESTVISQEVIQKENTQRRTFKEQFQNDHPLSYRVLFETSDEELALKELNQKAIQPLRIAVERNIFPVYFSFDGTQHRFYNSDELAEVMDSFNTLHALFF